MAQFGWAGRGSGWRGLARSGLRLRRLGRRRLRPAALEQGAGGEQADKRDQERLCDISAGDGRTDRIIEISHRSLLLLIQVGLT